MKYAENIELRGLRAIDVSALEDVTGGTRGGGCGGGYLYLKKPLCGDDPVAWPVKPCEPPIKPCDPPVKPVCRPHVDDDGPPKGAEPLDRVDLDVVQGLSSYDGGP